MAITIITVDQLRAETGDPGEDTRFAGHILDAQFQDIIDHWTEVLRSQALQRLTEDLAAQYSDIFTEQTVNVSSSAASSTLDEGDIPTDYFPFAINAVGNDGKALEWVSNKNALETKVDGSPWAYRGFSCRGQKVYIAPQSLDSVTLWLALEDDLIKRIFGDALAKARENIIRDAREMLQAKINEGQRPVETDVEQRPQ